MVHTWRTRFVFLGDGPWQTSLLVKGHRVVTNATFEDLVQRRFCVWVWTGAFGGWCDSVTALDSGRWLNSGLPPGHNFCFFSPPLNFSWRNLPCCFCLFTSGFLPLSWRDIFQNEIWRFLSSTCSHFRAAAIWTGLLFLKAPRGGVRSTATTCKVEKCVNCYHFTPVHHLPAAMESVAARMAMVTDSPNPSLKSRTTVTTDGDSFVSTASLPCSHFLSTNIVNIGECWRICVSVFSLILCWVACIVSASLCLYFTHSVAVTTIGSFVLSALIKNGKKA